MRFLFSIAFAVLWIYQFGYIIKHKHFFFPKDVSPYFRYSPKTIQRNSFTNLSESTAELRCHRCSSSKTIFLLTSWKKNVWKIKKMILKNEHLKSRDKMSIMTCLTWFDVHIWSSRQFLLLPKPTQKCNLFGKWSKVSQKWLSHYFLKV